jgi:hypothetical protein
MTCQGNILDQVVLLQVVMNISIFQADCEIIKAAYYVIRRLYRLAQAGALLIWAFYFERKQLRNKATSTLHLHVL